MWRETTATAPAPRDDRRDDQERPERQHAAGASECDQHAEPDDPGDADCCRGAADGPAAAVGDPAEERDAQGGPDVSRCDGIDAAADRVAGRRIDERQRRAARAERRAPGERTADARARECDAGSPEEPGIRGAEAVDRRADAVAEQGRAEAEHGEEGEGEPCHRHVSFREVIRIGAAPSFSARNSRCLRDVIRTRRGGPKGRPERRRQHA